MSSEPVLRDERTIAVENASYRAGYIFLTFALLVVVIVRSAIFQQDTWDLLGLVILSGFITTLYQVVQKTVSKKILLMYVYVALLSAACGAIILLVRKYIFHAF